MGGGYYDRYLPETRAYVLGVAFACQHSAAELPHESWDVGCNAVVTENGVLEFAS
jgi:5-formyltetrahydrofolate cyclo-ligase